MIVLRRLFMDHRRAAMLLIALALLVRALVPAGYMVGGDRLNLTVTLCGGVAGETMTMSIPMKPGHTKGEAKADSQCAFAGLGMQGLSGVDPLLLAAMILVAMALALRTPAPAPHRAEVRLRPPLRGPPVLI